MGVERDGTRGAPINAVLQRQLDLRIQICSASERFRTNHKPHQPAASSHVFLSQRELCHPKNTACFAMCFISPSVSVRETITVGAARSKGRAFAMRANIVPTHHGSAIGGGSGDGAQSDGREPDQRVAAHGPLVVQQHLHEVLNMLNIAVERYWLRPLVSVTMRATAGSLHAAIF